MTSESSSGHKTEESFLEELKTQFDRGIDLRKSVDNKTNNMLTISGSIATLNMAIGTFLMSKIQDHNLFYYIAIGILSSGIILSIISMWRLINSFNIQDYKYPFGHEFFFKGEVYQKDRVDKVRNLKEIEFKDRVFKGYLDSIKNAKEMNLEKTNKIKEGQRFLSWAILSVGIQIGFILVSSGLGVISLK